ncbi:type I-E CRISPR-associated protein Cas5/CasD [Oceanospirillum linum]|uniref:Type I-E CRISPR-associated protein Cas5/CasD n=1 Tax=Oceanospirillum linum TaxID=966 RepID=A0A1T1H983_OCELI|nr:type I-E CRISPR-associated protein Cas5/CasD [Oceanospirillum linum]OOV86277.1 type I-E CRISPR-associated protein Cas5/CasD [Oceanospirillum linum]SEG52482.1 CRISPR-associated protein, Cas5e family [Oleiphilus messinensis]SMP30592.1 CRISPR-associated protein, Cas5e family [Oceanospirillum linum]
MKDYLVLKLEGPMQAWGRESFEGLRPSELFPGRSALLGLLGACLGVDRLDTKGQYMLAKSVQFAVRIDQQGQKMTDYHTVKNARKEYSGLKSHETIQTWREYWQDAKYTVLVWLVDDADITLLDIDAAVKKPVYTPVLGRRSCALSRPLYEGQVSAQSALMAFSLCEPMGGTIYSDEFDEKAIPLKKRDVPIIDRPRQFASRCVYMTKPKKEGVLHVSE